MFQTTPEAPPFQEVALAEPLKVQRLTRKGPHGGKEPKPMEFHFFDADYVERLRSGDPQTEQHFVDYFNALIRLKLRRRLRSPSAVEDLRQEIIARVWVALKGRERLLRPERLGAFVNSVCNNTLFEHYRKTSREIAMG